MITSVIDIKFSLIHLYNNITRALFVPIGDLCIQVPISSLASNKTAIAWENAFDYIKNKFKAYPTTYTALQSQTDWKSNFKNELSGQFRRGGTSVSTYDCGNNYIPSNKPNYSVFCWN